MSHLYVLANVKAGTMQMTLCWQQSRGGRVCQPSVDKSLCFTCQKGCQQLAEDPLDRDQKYLS